MDMTARCSGDLHIDDHHTVEDVGIALGPGAGPGSGRQARHPALRRMPAWRWMTRIGALCALDLSGRPYLVWNVTLPTQKIGTFDTELVREFFQALRHPRRHHPACGSGARDQQPPHCGGQPFKAVARALRDGRRKPTRARPMRSHRPRARL
jgi:imidazoleglycerol-phosphate dehydratase